ncbi:hypothetical protein PILCRDRAFT_7939 [Piloderma croceum F 1598]|uniref:Protein kinase domain-containing protein n=1 Tax=Piloderma croceum (strain F 1598) TaxID=765440 RepID=A0A0C3FD01_PILCF|nr:hypothetical protein PILCRDRAFT_7939 [Piloderma croceum F 1598]
MSSLRLQDLTGMVRKIEKYYFANGGLADIWKGELSTRGSTQIVAVKVIRSAWSRSDQHEQLNMKLLREAKVWSELHHRNITPLYGICFDLGTRSAPCLVSPYFKHGNVARYLEEYPGADRMKLVSSDFTWTSNTRRSASNILVNDEHEACLTDFGLARILETSGFTTKSVGGTCRWMAYELVAPCDEEEECIPQVTVATDIWAFGMTTLEILSGELPFFQLKYDTAVILSVMRGGRPKRETYPTISHTIWTMLEQCWHADPSRRPSMEILSVFFSTRYQSHRPFPTLFGSQQIKRPLGPC